jgi:3-hydroxyacyl-[acyl-carrier-protein] dehydratase
MLFVFVDRVRSLQRRTSIEVTVPLSPGDPIFAVHFPARPMLPASLLLEAFAQAATILIETSSEFRLKAFPAFIRSAKFHRVVPPTGPPLRIRMDADQWEDDGSILRGVAHQGDDLCATCVLGMATSPLGQFYNPRHGDVLRRLYHHWLQESELEGFLEDPRATLDHALTS